MTRWWRRTVCVLLLGLGAGCVVREGPDAPIFIAVGTKRDLVVRNTLGNRANAVGVVVSDDPTVVAATMPSGGVVTVEAFRAGETKLRYRVEGEDPMKEHERLVTAFEPAMFGINLCYDAVTGVTTQIPFSFVDATLKHIVPGYGFYPVAFTPSANVTLDPAATTDRELGVRLLADATVTSLLNLPGNTPTSFDLHAHASAEVDATSANVTASLREGETAHGRITLASKGGLAAAGGRPTATVALPDGSVALATCTGVRVHISVTAPFCALEVEGSDHDVSSLDAEEGEFTLVALLAGGPCVVSYQVLDPLFDALPDGQISVDITPGVIAGLAGGGGGGHHHGGLGD